MHVTRTIQCKWHRERRRQTKQMLIGRVMWRPFSAVDTRNPWNITLYSIIIRSGCRIGHVSGAFCRETCSTSGYYSLTRRTRAIYDRCDAWSTTNVRCIRSPVVRVCILHGYVHVSVRKRYRRLVYNASKITRQRNVMCTLATHCNTQSTTIVVSFTKSLNLTLRNFIRYFYALLFLVRWRVEFFWDS